MIVGLNVMQKIYTEQSKRKFDVACTVEDLNEKNFYIEVLGWSEDV